MNRSRLISLIAVFAALSVVCDLLVFLPSGGIWFGMIFIVEALNGIILGPYMGFMSTLIGVMVGHPLVPRETVYEFIFTFGAPLGSMISGFLYRGRWKPILLYFTTLFAAYFVSPLSWKLPIWGMWDTYLAFSIIIILFLSRRYWLNQKTFNTPLIMAISAFVGLEADILFRIFLFIPCQTYSIIYGLSLEALQFVWVAGGLITPVKVLVSSAVAAISGPQLKRITQFIDRENL